MSIDLLTRAEAQGRAALLDGLTYDLTLDLPASGPTFTSTAVLRFDCTRPGASTFIDLDAASVTSAEVNGRPVAPDAVSAHRIRLDGLQAANEVRVVAECRYQHTGVGLHRVQDPVDRETYLFTHFEPFDAHKVFACFDQPDLKGRVTLRATAPDGWDVISNGAIVERVPSGEGRTLTTFATTPVISTYLVAVVAGPYHRVSSSHRGVDLGLYCRRSLAQYLDPDEIFEITRGGLDFFAERFGVPYAFGKYDQLFVPEFNMGAMENPGCVTFNEVYVFRSKVTETMRTRRSNTILHEMAHMWFGDLVTMRWWNDLWLNESFATYMGYLANATATRFTDAWVDFAAFEKAWARRQDQLPSTHPIVTDAPDTEAVRLNFDGITYAKGAAVLRQLVAFVGEDAFVEGLRAYFREHRWGNAELSDFLGAIERAAGRELETWAATWLQTAGISTIHPVTVNDDGRYTSVALVQEPPRDHPSDRAHRLAIGLYDADDGGRLTRRRRLEVELEGGRVEVPELAGESIPALLLVNDDDLTYAKVRLDPRSTDTLADHPSDIDRPLPRALCWAEAWDMTRDAELPAGRFLDIVVNQAPREARVMLVERVLLQATSAIDILGRPEHRRQRRARLAAAAREALGAAEPASDLQLAWARCLVSTSDSPSDLHFIRGLLEGTEAIAGLAVDIDLRWAIVHRLAESGAAGADVIDAEERRDPTDIGRRRAAAARAARPDAAAKEEAWRAITEEEALPLATMEAMIGGFMRPGQDALVRPYIDRYVEALAAIWERRTTDESLAFTQGMYPRYLTGDEVVAAADRALELPGLPAPGRRLVTEARDDTQRATRTRAADV